MISNNTSFLSHVNCCVLLEYTTTKIYLSTFDFLHVDSLSYLTVILNMDENIPSTLDLLKPDAQQLHLKENKPQSLQ